MKKLFIITSLVLVFGINCYAQNENKNDIELTYSCDELINKDLEKETITLIGNANLKTGVFEFQNADKIVINNVSKEIVVSGNCKVIFNDGTIQKAPGVKKTQLRYKIGEKIAYLE